MTDEKVKEVAERYRQELSKHFISKHERGPITKLYGLWTNEERGGHLLWMCDQIDAFVAAGRREKAMRWIGFLQGFFWRAGEFTVEELGQHSMPPPEGDGDITVHPKVP